MRLLTLLTRTSTRGASIERSSKASPPQTSARGRPAIAIPPGGVSGSSFLDTVSAARRWSVPWAAQPVSPKMNSTRLTIKNDRFILDGSEFTVRRSPALCGPWRPRGWHRQHPPNCLLTDPGWQHPLLQGASGAVVGPAGQASCDGPELDPDMCARPSTQPSRPQAPAFAFPQALPALQPAPPFPPPLTDPMPMLRRAVELPRIFTRPRRPLLSLAPPRPLPPVSASPQSPRHPPPWSVRVRRTRVRGPAGMAVGRRSSCHPHLRAALPLSRRPLVGSAAPRPQSRGSTFR